MKMQRTKMKNLRLNGGRYSWLYLNMNSTGIEGVKGYAVIQYQDSNGKVAVESFIFKGEENIGNGLRLQCKKEDEFDNIKKAVYEALMGLLKQD